MKELSMKFILGILSTIIFITTINAEKLALIVAVGTYEVDSGWSDTAAANDAIYIKTALINQGFKPENIETLHDSKATNKGIHLAITRLKRRAKLNDVVYIHFSGHGQQVIDDNGDEIDGLDEAFVPFDSFMQGNKGDKLLRDDVLGMELKALQSLVGGEGQIWFVMDACHSGTSTRGLAQSRGTTVVLGIDESDLNADTAYGIVDNKSSKLASLVALFASGSNEMNYEYCSPSGDQVGSLSYALASVLAKNKQTLTTAEFFDRIKLKMAIIAPNQHPQMEGNASQYVFDNGIESSVVLYDIQNVISPKNIKVNFGSLHNIPIGSKIEVLSIDKHIVLSEGVVMSLNISSAVVQLEKSLFLKKEELAKVKVTEKACANLQCRLNIDHLDIGLNEPIVQELIDKQLCEIVNGHSDLFLIRDSLSQKLQLYANCGVLICETKPQKSDFYNQNIIAKGILSFAQSEFLRNYMVESGALDVELALLPALNNPANQLGLPSYKEGQVVKFKITNHHSKPVYYTVLVIGSDHQVNLLLPAPFAEHQPVDFYIKPGETQVIDTPFTFGQPYGVDLLKLIATNVPLDLGGVLATRGADLDQPSHSFEQIFAYSFDRNRGKNASISIEEIGISNLAIEVIE